MESHTTDGPTAPSTHRHQQLYKWISASPLQEEDVKKTQSVEKPPKDLTHEGTLRPCQWQKD